MERLIATGHETRQQKQCRHPMPGIQIPITQIREKTPEPGKPAQDKKPPCPCLAITKRKFRHPQVKRTDGDQRASKRNAIMEHKVNNSTLVHRTERLGCHAKKPDVVWQKASSCREKKCEPTASKLSHLTRRPRVKKRVWPLSGHGLKIPETIVLNSILVQVGRIHRWVASQHLQ